VPEELFGELMLMVYERSVMRPGATVVPMGRPMVRVPAIDQTVTVAAGKTAQFGGVELTWRDPLVASVVPETEPAVKAVELVARELQADVKISNELVADGKAMMALVPGMLAEAAAWAQDYAFLRGSGTRDPLGVVNWQGAIWVTRSGAGQFGLADVAGMLARFIVPQRVEDVVWAMHPSVLAKLVATPNGANVLHCIADPRTGRAVYLLAGYEVRVTEKLPGLGTAGDVLLVDRSKYLIGDRGMEVAFSPQPLFTSNQSIWRVVSRVAGQPWLRDKVTLADGATTVSAVVGVAG
jgi:HK97 family phage major capsid protein